MMGVHPTDVDDSWEHEIEVIERYLAAPDPLDPPFCAIGEVGLDLHYGADHLPQQIAAFERQIELSVRYNLPLSIHTRDAWPEMFVVLEKYADRRLRGVMHAFSGTVDEYRRVRELGDFAFGVTGVVTYKKNHWRALLPEMNPAHIILETDAPWLPPEPFRGKRNESSYLGYIRDGVAAILGMTPGEVDRITTENADRIFGLDLP
jgi:TatD DNase family protein